MVRTSPVAVSLDRTVPVIFAVEFGPQDPAVELLERMHIPRTLGSLLMVLVLIAALAAVGYSLWIRTSDFAAQWHRSG